MARQAQTAQDVAGFYGIDMDDDADLAEDAPVFPKDDHRFVAASGGDRAHQPPNDPGADLDDIPEPEQGSQASAGTKPASSPTASGERALSRSYEVRGVTFDRLKIAAPRGVDFWELGEPESWALTSTGAPVSIANDAVIRSYAERCVSADRRLSGADVLDALNLQDVRMVRRTVLGFFAAPAGE